MMLLKDLRPDQTPVVWLEETGQVMYALQPKQLECFNLLPVARAPGDHVFEHTGYGGSAGSGKSHLARATLAAVAMTWPGSTSIIFRKTEREVMENHVNKFFAEVPKKLNGKRVYSWNGEEMCAHWFNGSRTYFGYLRLDDDVFRYQGPEYDVMIFEEATHYSWKMVNWLTANRLRATVPEARPFCLYPSNPGNKGHAWFKRLFIDRNFHTEDDERPEEYTFVQARLSDNQILRDRDPKYERRLNRLPEPWRSWMRDGDWTAGAGGAFPELDSGTHFVKPFAVPPHWRQFGAFDWGYHHPFSFGHYAIDEDGTVFKLDTITAPRMQPHDIARLIKYKVPNVEQLEYIVAGHDLWARGKARGDVGETLFEYFASQGIYCIHADIDRIQGYQNLLRMLAWQSVEAGTDGEGQAGEPQLKFFDTVGNRWCFNQLESMVLNEANMEDVLKQDADERGDNGDDCYDETRYGAMSCRRRAYSEDPPSGGAWSQATLQHEYETKMRVTDLPATEGRMIHPEFGGFY
jgi:hypothetical protein